MCKCVCMHMCLCACMCVFVCACVVSTKITFGAHYHLNIAKALMWVLEA